MHHPARHRRPALSRNFFNAIMAGSLVLMGWLSFASFHAIEPVFHSHWHPGATGGGRGAGASDVVTAPGPVPLVPEFGLKEPPVDAQQSCHAHAHVDAYGEALVSGDRHIKSTPGECCAACRAYNGTGNPCNVWVFCGDKAKCGATFGQCWLKYTKPAIALQMLQHGGAKEVPWISGLSLDKPIEEYINQATNDRAARMRSELTLVASKHLTVGLRNETGTVEFLSPAELPSFSYVLPLDDPNVLLTATTHLDRRGNNYHHLGDVSLRVKTARYGDASIRCSTVHSGALKENATAAASLAAGGGGALQEGAAAGGWLWRHSRELAPKIYDNPMQRVPVGDCPVELTRHIVAEPESLGGAIQIRFELRNPASAAGPTTVTDLGIPMPFDHHFAGRTLVQVANQCSFVEPFLGAGGGYIQVARASGGGPVLLLLPLAGTEVENWRPLREEDQARGEPSRPHYLIPTPLPLLPPCFLFVSASEQSVPPRALETDASRGLKTDTARPRTRARASDHCRCSLASCTSTPTRSSSTRRASRAASGRMRSNGTSRRRSRSSRGRAAPTASGCCWPRRSGTLRRRW